MTDDILTNLRRIELEKERQNHAQKMSLTKSKRRDMVFKCFVDRYTVEQTRDYIYQQTNAWITTRTIDRDRDYIKSEASKFFYVLAKDKIILKF